jgi:CRP-like cAMP-binding protein
VTVEETIRASGLFGSLPEADIERLAGAALGRSYGKEEVIFAEGEEAGGFHMLERGRVKIYKLSPAGKEQILHVVNPGEVFGEAAVFSGSRFPAHARALEESRTVYFDAGRFRAQVAANPELALHMLGAMARHLRRFAGLVEQLSLRDVRSRLAEYLLGLPADAGGTAALPVTKRELAAHLGTQPETLSRALGALQADNVIAVEGRDVRILDGEGLEDAAGSG